MSTRTLEILLKANVAQFAAQLGVASAEAKRFGRDVAGMGDRGKKDLSGISTAALGLGGAMQAGVGLAAVAAARFDAEMSQVQAVTGATALEMGALRDQAIAAGAATVFSATEAAQAQTELAKAGVATRDILAGGLYGALNLASAGNLDLATAAEIAAQAMTTFGLSGRDVPHIADVLAAAANKSAADVDDMAQAMQQAGLVADLTGLSFEDTAGALAGFAQAGLRGSDAGTSLKTMLMRLNPTTAEAKETMAALGLSFYDTEGNFVGLEAAAGQLQGAMSRLTPEAQSAALATLFGTDAIRGAAIVSELGADGVRKWTDEVDQAGYAAELAAVKNDNLKGDIEALSGSIETLAIRTGEGLQGPLRGLVQWSTDAVNGLGAMPPAAQTAAGGVTALSGTVLVAVGAAGSLIPKYRELTGTLTEMGSGGATAAKGLGVMSVGLAAAMPGVLFAASRYGALQGEVQDAVAALKMELGGPPTSYREYADQINQVIAVYDSLEATAAKGDGLAGFNERFWENVGFDDEGINRARETRAELEGLLNEMIPGFDAWGDANARLQSELGLTQDEVDVLAQKAGVDLAASYESVGRSMGLNEQEIEQHRSALEEVVPTVDENVAAIKAFHTEQLAGTAVGGRYRQSLEDLASASLSAEDRLAALDKTLQAFHDSMFGEQASWDALQGDINALPDILKEVAWDFDGTSDAAIAYRAHMAGMNADAQAMILTWVEQGVTGDELTQKINGMSLEFYNQAIAMGVPKEEADKYLSVLSIIPEDVRTAISAPGADGAKAVVGDLNGALDRARQGAHGVVTVDTGQAMANVAALGSVLDGVKGRLMSMISGPAYTMGSRSASAGRASGGMVAARHLYEVNEQDHPEMLTAGGRHYLMPGRDGTVTPMAQFRAPAMTAAPAAGAGATTVVNEGATFNVTVQAPNYVGDHQDLVDVVTEELRRFHRSIS